MDIVNVAISELKEAEYNPRKLSTDQFEQIKTSLQRFGFVDPVIVNKDNTIIGGHQRVKVWKAIGQTHVPVFYVDLTKDQEKELNLRLNKNTGDWDWGKLENFFDFTQLRDVGFTDRDLNINIRPKKHIGEDYVPPAPPVAKRGDIFQLNNHRIMCGDSTNPVDIVLLMAGQKADMVFTDPPYNVNYKGIGKKTSNTIDNDNMTQAEFIKFLIAAFNQYNLILRENGSFYCCYATLLNGLIDRKQRFLCFENHTKIMLFRQGETYYVCEGSANFTANPRMEQNIICNSPRLYNFHRDWMEAMLQG